MDEKINILGDDTINTENMQENALGDFEEFDELEKYTDLDDLDDYEDRDM